MQDIIIRRPKKEDVNQLNDFFQLVLKDTFEKNGIENLVEDYEQEIREKREFLNEDIETGGKKRYFLVAEISNNIVGTIAYGPANHLINKCTNDKLKDLIEIGTVFVHPDYQKKGIGSFMLNYMYDVLNRKDIKEFCLDSGYKNAQKTWLKKFGDPEYHFEGYWGEGTDYMIWRVKLENVSN